MAFMRADILLPEFAGDPDKMKKWSVVACDQYTSEPEYWKQVNDLVSGEYSTLYLTVPEIYLNDDDIELRIKNTNANMDEYVKQEVFKEYKNSYLFVTFKPTVCVCIPPPVRRPRLMPQSAKSLPRLIII